jgi:tRNA(fMet)-specific endonuclease VapC
MILDTTFFVDVLRGDVRDNPAAEEYIENMDAAGTGKISSVSVMELWEGIHLAEATTTERTRVEELIEGIYELPFDRDVAMLAGELSAALISQGEPIEDSDVMIGATALLHNEPVLTRNVEHFERIEGLDIHTY